jgi:hypothetical protein
MHRQTAWLFPWQRAGDPRDRCDGQDLSGAADDFRLFDWVDFGAPVADIGRSDMLAGIS